MALLCLFTTHSETESHEYLSEACIHRKYQILGFAFWIASVFLASDLPSLRQPIYPALSPRLNIRIILQSCLLCVAASVKPSFHYILEPLSFHSLQAAIGSNYPDQEKDYCNSPFVPKLIFSKIASNRAKDKGIISTQPILSLNNCGASFQLNGSLYLRRWVKYILHQGFQHQSILKPKL